ncbi:hypothetical protein EHS89_16110 [Amphritea balenae]|uniref:Uncharacterized protein n=1 Tax=Amphritea balenae TaxID=452629 RepID=A0A3P1SL78_9GAMM|nr:hypothetical protein [Amphritea balenae]RRC97704.1 hypothetical protein EHS89_16110 [Amphritea balenae]
MQINSTSFSVLTTQARKTAYSLPASEEQSLPSTQERPSTRELASTIDPKNMSRNDAAALGDALARAGETELGMFFLAQSMILVNENGNLRTATKTDSVMNEQFNMFDSLQSQIEFAKSKSLSTDTLDSALKFLDKFQLAGVTPEVNLYT